jgi:hypothetical protein
MDFDETLAHVESLLSRTPEVEVETCNPGPDATLLELVVWSMESLAWLAHIATFANVELLVGTVPSARRWGEPFDPAELRYTLWVPNDPEPVMPPSRLQKIGLFLARELKLRGLLDAVQADRLQKDWNATVM